MKSYDQIVNVQLQEKVLKEIRDVLFRMEKRLNTIESMMYVDEVAKKQILKGNE
jgi:glycerol-3-phosphate cytidylyltransferase-like family protein